MEPIEKFRQETREWLEANCPASMRTPMPEEETPWGGRNATWVNPDSKVWLDRMASRGWTAPTWPKEYGGGGLTKEVKPRPQPGNAPHQGAPAAVELRPLDAWAGPSRIRQ